MASGSHDQACVERDPPLISVVVPTYDRCERLRRVLAALVDQDLHAPYEVVVVSDGSTDGTEDLLRERVADRAPSLDLRWATQANSGPAAARNRGALMASAPILLFVDDDVVPGRGLLSAHAYAHRDAAPGTVVIGPMLDPPDHRMTPWVAWEQRMLYKQYDALTDGSFDTTFRQFYTGNASMSRSVFVSSGGFRVEMRRAEDVELGVRLWERGADFAFAPAAEGFHYATRSFAGWRQIAQAYGAADVEIARSDGRTWQWEFLARKFTSPNPGLRFVVLSALRAPRLAEVVMARSGRAIEIIGGRRIGRNLVQPLLSLIYAIDYWGAAMASLGGRRELIDMADRHRNGDSWGDATDARDIEPHRQPPPADRPDAHCLDSHPLTGITPDSTPARPRKGTT